MKLFKSVLGLLSAPLLILFAPIVLIYCGCTSLMDIIKGKYEREKTTIKKDIKLDTQSYIPSLNDNIENSAGSILYKVIGGMALVITFLTIFIEKIPVIILLIVGSVILLIFFIISLVLGCRRIVSYRVWLNRKNDRIKKLLRTVDKEDDMRKAENLINNGQTMSFLSSYPELFLKLSPPRLWNSIYTTRAYVFFSAFAIVFLLFFLYSITVINYNLW